MRAERQINALLAQVLTSLLLTKRNTERFNLPLTQDQTLCPFVGFETARELVAQTAA